MKRTTIRDIANHCGVSPTIVSAVLNNPWRARCSQEKIKLIQKTAKELHYSPNALAQAMVSKRVPVVALMLCSTVHNRIYRDAYFSEDAPRFVYTMQGHKIEVLLIFYRDEQEQIERFESLLKKGLIGGVASNIIPFSHKVFLTVLKDSKIPYVIFGHTTTPGLCVYSKKRYSFVADAHKHFGTKKCYLLMEQDDKQMLYPYEDNDDYDQFDYEPVAAVDEITNDPQNLILILGAEYYLRSKRKFTNPFIIERINYKYLIPSGISYALYDQASDGCEVFGAKLLIEWIQGKKPEEQAYCLPGNKLLEIFLADKV